MIMRRNIISLFKFIFLSLATIGFTIILFKLVRNVDKVEYEKLVAPQNPNPNPVEPIAPVDLFADFDEDNSKIDWHDYAAIQRDLQRNGIGEQGKPAHLTAKESNLYDKLFKENGFNAALSDKISMHRALPDIRNEGCKAKKYLKHLGTVSVVVPFHNEHWSTLLRTAYSVIDRSPAHLLKEIILVDDCSTKEFSNQPLDDYVRVNLTKVTVVHLPSRQGLIRARLAGARIARGDVLVFLDSHTEANVNWLPPLLEPIAQDYKTCVCPFIDVIAWDTFEYRAQDEGARGAFDWEFFYKRLPLLPEDLEHPTEPFKSPVMAGGLFAISRKFFWELGGYDEGLDIWGGEQYELSFKIWQCGGQMYDAPCSRVGHIYRKFAPFPNPRKGDFVGKNYRRVAEVWMDEYAEFLYKRRPHYRLIETGDLTEQKAIREKLQCKPFKWFMEKIAFDLPLKYPPIEPDDFATGEIRSLAAPELCVDTQGKNGDSPFGLKECVKDDSVRKGEQKFTLTWHKDIRPKGRSMCWDISNPHDKAEITLYSCHGMGGNQFWKYDVEHQWLIHGKNPRCLDCDPGKKTLYVTKCDDTSVTQKWRFEHVDLKAINNWDSIGPK